MAKKRKQKMYPRATNTTIKKPIIITTEQRLIAKMVNGNVELVDEQGVPYSETDIDMEKTYLGQNKKRIIAKAIGLEKGGISVGDWIKNFDIIYAIDTNTKKINNEKNCSVGMLYKATIEQIDKNGGYLHCSPYICFQWIWNTDIKIETYSWCEAIREIQNIESKDKKIALVIDSELGYLEQYNNHTLPIAGNVFLPDNFTMLYASADYNDEWINKLIKLCDKKASEQLDSFIPYVLENGLDKVQQDNPILLTSKCIEIKKNEN